MAHIQIVNGFSGTIDWDGVSDTFENISADAYNQLGLQGDNTNATIGLDEEDAQNFFILGDTLHFDPDHARH